MPDKINLGNIKKIVEEFLDKMTFDVEVEMGNLTGGAVRANLKMDDPQFLIGQNGETLSELQHLLKIVLYKKLGSPIFFDLDIDGYKDKKIEYLKELARESADEVSLAKKEKILPPMRSFERRIVHIELLEHPGVKAESIGEEPQRRIVVKPS